MKKPETRFKERCKKDLLFLDNLWYFKTQEVAVRGIPDFIMCINGFFVAIELKKDSTAEADALQTYTLNRIRGKGKGLSYLADPSNWESILADLKQLDSIPGQTLALLRRKLLVPVQSERLQVSR